MEIQCNPVETPLDGRLSMIQGLQTSYYVMPTLLSDLHYPRPFVELVGNVQSEVRKEV